MACEMTPRATEKASMSRYVKMCRGLGKNPRSDKGNSGI